MKNVSFLILAVLSSSTTLLHAQDNFRSGYIITNENDTVFGMIDFRTAEQNAQGCCFRADASGQVQRYEPGGIYAYRFLDDGKFYVTRTVTINKTTRTLFLEYLVKGVISLYYYRAPLAQYYFFEDENGRLIEVPDKERAVKIDRVPGIKKDRRYVGIMTLLFGKSEKIKQQLPKLRLSRESLSKITKEYHYETCQLGEECIEFEFKQDSRFLHVDFSLSAGVRAHSFSSKAVGDYRTSQGVVSGNVKNVFPSIAVQTDWFIPRLSKNASLQLGVELSRLKGSDEFRTNHTYNNFDFSSFLTDIRAGLCFRLCRTSIYPIIGGGFCDTFFWNMDACNYRKVNIEGRDDPMEKVDFSNEISKNYIGFYVNAGVVFPFKSGSIFIQGLMEQRKKSGDKLSTWGGNIGYRF